MNTSSTLLLTTDIMDFPPEWVVLPAEDFTTAAPHNSGICGMELLAQIRPNGRILDHFRVSLDGSKILEVNTPLSSLMPSTLELGLPDVQRGVSGRAHPYMLR